MRFSRWHNASTGHGLVAPAMASVQRIVAGQTGQYGLAAGSSGLVPQAAQ